FFRHEELTDLSTDEATQLLANIAKLKGNSELERFIQTPTGRDRIQAVHFLAGGNHRLYVIFSEFLTHRKSLDQLTDAFMRTLDDLTPYYQERMRYLSPQQRKIIDFLCDRRHAVTVKEIAQRCFMTHQTASSQLKKLLEMSYVRSEPIGRESYYELRESLMRFCLEVKKQRGEPIQLFVDFLRLWYTQTELEQRLELLPPEAKLEREYVLHALQVFEEENEDPRVAAYWKDCQAYLDKEDFVHALPIAEKLIEIRGNANDWLTQGHCLSQLGRKEQALVSFNKAAELNPNDLRVWFLRGLDLAQLEQYEQALTSFDKVIELDPIHIKVWSFRGMALEELGHYEEALVSFNKATELEPNNAFLWERRGWVLTTLERYEEALISFNKATELEPNDAFLLHMRGMVQCKLECYQEALASIDKGIALGEQSSAIFFNRAEVLLALNRWDEASAALDYAHVTKKGGKNASTRHLPILRYRFIIIHLFNSTHDAALWQTRIKSLIAFDEKPKILFGLGKGLVQSIPDLMSEMVSDKAAKAWLDVWWELTSGRPEFQFPLRLLNAAVRYRETKGDKRVLLELPIEERKLLKVLLGIREEE
ncbi:MAG TPA: tetratricopeptide repeat protein, partial [Allocoleopsis sp.]